MNIDKWMQNSEIQIAIYIHVMCALTQSTSNVDIHLHSAFDKAKQNELLFRQPQIEFSTYVRAFYFTDN